MSFDGSDPCWIPDIPVSRTAEWRLRIAAFGDGYQQRILDGINALDLRWQVDFDRRPRDVILAMDSYLVSMKGDAFLFKDPLTNNVHRVFCDTWQIDLTITRTRHATATTSQYGALSAEFVKANGVSI